MITINSLASALIATISIFCTTLIHSAPEDDNSATEASLISRALTKFPASKWSPSVNTDDGNLWTGITLKEFSDDPPFGVVGILYTTAKSVNEAKNIQEAPLVSGPHFVMNPMKAGDETFLRGNLLSVRIGLIVVQIIMARTDPSMADMKKVVEMVLGPAPASRK